MSGRRILKSVLIVLLCVVVLLGLLLGGAAYYVSKKQEEIKRIVVREVNKYLTAPVSVRQIEVGLFKDFPLLSVSFYGVQASSNNPDDEDAVLYAETVRLTFSLTDVLKKRYAVREVLLHGGDLNLKHYEGEKFNYEIWKTPENPSGDVTFRLHRILLRNTFIRYRDLPGRHDYQILARAVNARGTIIGRHQDFTLKGDVRLQSMVAAGFHFLSDRKAMVDIEFSNEGTEKTFRIPKGNIVLSGLHFGLTGYVRYMKRNRYLELAFAGQSLKMGTVLNLLPKETRRSLGDYTFAGSADFMMKLKGDYSKSVLTIYSKFNYADGTVTHKPSRIAATEVNLAGTFTNGNKHKAESSRLYFEKLSAKLPGGFVNGTFSINNFKVPEIGYTGVLEADVAQLKEFLKLMPGSKMQGRVHGEVAFKNRFPSLSPSKWETLDFSAVQVNGFLDLHDFVLVPEGKTDKLETDSLRLVFTPKTVKTNTFTVKYTDQQVKTRIFFDNLLSYCMLPAQQLYVSACLSTPSLDWKKWQALFVAPQTENSVPKPGDSDSLSGRSLLQDLRADVELHAGEVLNGDFCMRAVSGNLYYAPDAIRVESLSFEAFEGGFKGMAAMKKQAGESRFLIDGRIDRIDISQCFAAFNNSGQTQITSAHIGGRFSSDLQLKLSYFEKTHKWEPASIALRAKVEITDGVLQDMESLQKIAKFTGEKELKRIRFADLKTTVAIRDKCVRIDKMDVKSDVADLSFEGTHTFSNELDYRVNIELSDLLSRRRAKRVTNPDEFGVVEKDKTRIRLPLVIQGKSPDLKIKYDFTQAKKGAKERLEENQEEFKQAWQEEFSDSRQKREQRKVQQENVKRQENGEFIIELEEDTREPSAKAPVKPPVSKPAKKYNTQEDFKFEFEDE